jgi:hypothetical protein
MPWKPPHLVALLVACMASWLERRAAAQIDYLKAENRALRSRLGKRRILFTDAERRTLAGLAKGIGSKALRELDLERNHQGLDNNPIASTPVRCSKTQPIDCRSRLGGILQYYERAVA